MSDEILPKSRTELDKQSFTRDANDKIARRVIDESNSTKLDEVKDLLIQIEENTDELELKAENINLNTDDLEEKLDITNGHLSDINSGIDVTLSSRASESTASSIATSTGIMDDWDELDRAKVNPIVGQAGVQGNAGVVTANTQRVTLATDIPLPTGTNSIGQVTANAGVNLNTSALALETTQQTTNTRIGDLTETAPISDTASSGLNGRLQRIAQRLTSIFTGLSDGTQQTKIKGNTDGTLIGNFEDAQKIVIQRTKVTGFDNTYSAAISSHTFASNPTDIFTITGSDTKTIRILRVTFSATKSTAANLGIVFLRRSTDNTGGTFTTLTNTKRDSLSPVATAQVRAYTTNPTTLGTSAGEIFATRYYFSSGTGLGFGEVGVDFEHDLGGPIILRGTNEIFSINLLGTGVTVSGNLTEITIDWTEV